MDVHVINLDRTYERLTSFRANNQHLNSIVRFAAVDGGTIPLQQLAARGIFSADAPSYSNGAIGCALSHLSLWEQAAQQSGPFTVAEDDAILNRNFEIEAHTLLQTLPLDWDIMLWGWNFDSILLFDFLPGISPCLGAFSEPELRAHTEEFQQLEVKPRAYRLQRAFGTLAYSVSPTGARKLTRHCLPIRKMDVFCPGLNRSVSNFGIDVMINALYPNINAYVSFPPLAVSRNEKTSSTVNRQDEGAGRQSAARASAAQS